MARYEQIGIGTAHRSRPPHRGPPEAGQRLIGDAGSVRTARAMVEELMGGQPPERRDVAVLLTDELVTNALLHGGGQFSLVARLDDHVLRVEVGDRSGEVPRVLRPSEEREHGRGMAIVDALATNWGTDQEHRSKTVWFELSLPG